MPYLDAALAFALTMLVVATCDWAAKTSRRNKEAYQDLERALKHGYDGCRFCLPEYSKD